MYTVYIIYSEKLNRYYIGCTKEMEVRLKFHLEATQSRKFTYRADDWVLFFKIECMSKIQAQSVEKHIKKMKSRTYIQNLLKYPEMSTKLLENYSAIL